MIEKKIHTITFKVSEDTYNYLQKLARINKCTVSEVIRTKIELPKQWKEPRESTIRKTQD